MPKNTPEKHTPLTVAIGLVTKLASAASQHRQEDERQANRHLDAAPVKLNGTANSRGCRFLNRNTTIDTVLNTKLQITPNAYASPSRMTSPRLTRIVSNCSASDQIQHSIVRAVAAGAVSKTSRAARHLRPRG